MNKTLLLHDYNTQAPIIVVVSAITFVMPKYRQGAKPEDDPIGTLIGVHGAEGGILVQEKFFEVSKMLDQLHA